MTVDIFRAPGPPRALRDDGVGKRRDARDVGAGPPAAPARSGATRERSTTPPRRGSGRRAGGARRRARGAARRPSAFPRHHRAPSETESGKRHSVGGVTHRPSRASAARIARGCGRGTERRRGRRGFERSPGATRRAEFARARRDGAATPVAEHLAKFFFPGRKSQIHVRLETPPRPLRLFPQSATSARSARQRCASRLAGPRPFSLSSLASSLAAEHLERVQSRPPLAHVPERPVALVALVALVLAAVLALADRRNLIDDGRLTPIRRGASRTNPARQRDRRRRGSPPGLRLAPRVIEAPPIEAAAPRTGHLG